MTGQTTPTYREQGSERSPRRLPRQISRAAHPPRAQRAALGKAVRGTGSPLHAR